ncbi:MAG: chromate transporter [Chloroflexi bacterium RBG_16_58_14]|nr:MAG: chromate transporter [Chloroflexi bacterium RBG_16_58_14]
MKPSAQSPLVPQADSHARLLREVAQVFLFLGFTAFGGPAAHIGLFRHEIVKRRRWLTDQQFLDLLGATNLIPGPNSTEMAIHTGYLRAGWGGLVLGGVGFALPATLIVLGLSWIYQHFGSLPQASWLLYGIKPVIIAVIVLALWNLGKQAIKGPLTGIAGGAVVLLYLLGVNALALLLIAALLVALITNARRLKPGLLAFSMPSLAGLGVLLVSSAPFNLATLFLTFLKIGSVLYGSGYVLFAFLHSDFVERLGWLTDQQLIDAIAIGQVTPGPLFTSATFIGYLLAGVPGALLATLGIFLPSFIFVALSNPLILRLRNSPLASALLDGVNVASLGLMAAVTWELGRAALVDPLTILMAGVSIFVLFKFNPNSSWLILAGALVGILRSFLG